MTNISPFSALDFVDEVSAGVPWNVLGLTSGVIAKAAIELNNAGVLLPENEWRALRDHCELLTAISEAYARASVERMP